MGSCWHPDMAEIAARSLKDLMQKLRMRTPDGESAWRHRSFGKALVGQNWELALTTVPPP
ncbi:MAG: hypothetical protein ACJ8AP_07910 [Gemmatimonadales bacterium]